MHDLFGLVWIGIGFVRDSALGVFELSIQPLEKCVPGDKRTNGEWNVEMKEKRMRMGMKCMRRPKETTKQYHDGYIDIDVQQLINANISILKVKVIIRHYWTVWMRVVSVCDRQERCHTNDIFILIQLLNRDLIAIVIVISWNLRAASKSTECAWQWNEENKSPAQQMRPQRRIGKEFKWGSAVLPSF